MNILVPAADPHEQNPSRYVAVALQQLGHQARVITQAEYYQDYPDADLFFCVDSSGPMDFPEKYRSKSVMWFIDSRRNNDPERRKPDDDTNAKLLADGGGWIFQAQKRDWQRNVEQGIVRCSWLPLAADPDVWKPMVADKIYDVGFGGNIWCNTRREMLERIEKKGWKLGQFVGSPQELVEGYAQSRIGFNISSFYGTDIAYDVNMRVFEVLSCGVPLITNYLPELLELGILSEDTCLTYQDQDGAMSQIRLALQRGAQYRCEMAKRARQLILECHTYKHRMEEALAILFEAWTL